MRKTVDTGTVKTVETVKTFESFSLSQALRWESCPNLNWTGTVLPSIIMASTYFGLPALYATPVLPYTKIAWQSLVYMIIWYIVGIWSLCSPFGRICFSRESLDHGHSERRHARECWRNQWGASLPKALLLNVVNIVFKSFLGRPG